MQPHSLLDQQKRAAARSAHCHDLARLRTLQGCLGTAKFYQYEAARLHVRACELRDQLQNPQPLPGLRILNVVIDDKAASYRRLKERVTALMPGFLMPTAIDDRCIIIAPNRQPVFIGIDYAEPNYIVGERG